MKFKIILTLVVVVMMSSGGEAVVELTKDNIETICQLNTTSIDCESQGIESIAKDAFINFGANIEKINLANNSISKLESGTFATLTGAEYLILIQNELTSVPVDLFDPQNNRLKFFWLHSNLFETLNLDQFQNYPNIYQVNLMDNQIRSVTSSSSLPSNVVFLNLDRNNLESLEQGVFKTLVKMQFLFVRSNQITSIHPEFIGAENDLQFVWLTKNKLTTLDRAMFQNLDKIISLEIQSNEIASITGKSSSSSSNIYLGNLELSNNKLDRIDEETFSSFNSLRTLILNHNVISKLDPDSFKSNNKLQELNLAHNKLETVEPGTFRPLDKLQTLHLEKNSLTKIPGIEIYCTATLTTLDLCDNKLEYIDQSNCNNIDSIYQVWEEKYGFNTDACPKATTTTRPSTTTKSAGVRIIVPTGLQMTTMGCIIAVVLLKFFS